MRRALLVATACLAMGCSGRNSRSDDKNGRGEPTQTAARQAPSHKTVSLLAIDTHVDTPQRMLDDNDDISALLEDGHLDVPRMQRGGLNAAFFSVWVNPRKYKGEAAWERARALIKSIQRVVEQHPDKAALCTTGAHVRRVAGEGRVCLLIGVEGAHALGTGDLKLATSRLRWLFEQGARYMTITWSTDNPFAHSSTGDAPAEGLTAKGRALVQSMNNLGMVVDVSHVSDQTLFDIMDVTTKPVLASHSSARALAQHPRNMTDTMIKRVASAGGAVCVNFYSRYIDDGFRARREAVEAAHKAEFEAVSNGDDSWRRRAAKGFALAKKLDATLNPPGMETLVAHFEHVVKVGGAGAACLGSDFDGVPELPTGIEDVSKLPVLRAALEARGLPVAAIFSGNVLRVLDAQMPQQP